MKRNSYKYGQFLLLSLASLMLLGCSSDDSDKVVAADDSSTIATMLKVDPLTRLVEGEVTVAGFTATNVHIHEGATGVDGSVIFTLSQDSGNANRYVIPTGSRLTVSQYDSYLADSIYFNAHSAAKPTGEVREQISAKTIDTSMVDYSSLPSVSGYIMTTGFTATLAHIHTGFAGASGNISVALEADSSIAGRYNLPTNATVPMTEYNAGQLYFNVHSADFGSGHIREQIVPTGIKVLGVEVTGAQVATAVTDGGSGTAYVTVNEATGALNITLDLHTIDDATAVHLHEGATGVSSGFLQDPESTFVGAANDTKWTISDVNLTTGAGNALEKLLAGNSYINVHTTSHGSGEARGQITP